MADHPQPPTIGLYERIELPTGYHRYEIMDDCAISLPAGELTHWAVPAVGDTIGIGRHTYRVTDRSWSYPQRGSAVWPAGERYPDRGPSVTLITEKTSGPFTNETPDPKDGNR